MTFKGLRLLTALIPFLYFGIADAQNQENYGKVSIASPNAAALGKYADIPISYHTGVPQINIPLYTVSAGPLSLPIGLSYHASGLKVTETSSWVGAGWSLDAGGVITRTVVGLPDEKNTGTGAVDLYGYFSDFGYNKYINKDFQNEDWVGFSQGRKDGEPDLFFFNFAGYSGKFFFRDDHTPILVPQQDLKIVPIYPGTGSIQGFTIITPDGTQYVFGNTPGFPGSTAPVEMTNPYSSETGYQSGTALSSWFLNKVISSDGQFSISLSYVPESYGYYNLSSVTLDVPFVTGQHEFHIVKNIITGVRLSQISFSNGTVTFNPGAVRTDLSDNGQNFLDYPNSSATALGSIVIANTSSGNGFSKKYNFSYGYFADNTTPTPDVVTTLQYPLQTDKNRLRLDSIKESSSDNLIQIPARKFTYFSDFVPRRLSLSIDHWGFYNGVTSNQTLIPTYSTYDGVTVTPVPGANRNSAWPSMRGGALKQINYPTGGSTQFDFEPIDTYVNSNATLESVQLNASTVHLYGQDTKYSDVVPIVSNGNPITATVFNNTRDVQVSIVIKNSSNAVVYSQGVGDNNYPTGQTTIVSPISLAAGTYTASFTLPSGPASGEGASVTYSQLANVVHPFTVIIGGLRIKTVTSSVSSTDPNPIVTNYSYPNGAYVYSVPTYVQHARNDVVNTLGYFDLTEGFWKNITNAQGCPIGGGVYKKSGGGLRPMATTQGFHAGFPIVKVAQTGNGYSLYNYYLSNSGFAPQIYDPTVQPIDVRFLACEPTTPNYPPAPLPYDTKKGELYYEQHYTESGQLLKDAYYYPEYDFTSQMSTPGFIVADVPGFILGTYYNIVSPKKIKNHIIETAYAAGLGGVKTEKYIYYGSSFHNQATREAVSISTGDSVATNTKYAQDFHSSSWDVSPTSEASYTAACNSCQATYNTAIGAGGCSTNTCLSNAFLSYRTCVSNARNSYVDNRVANYTGATNTYTTNHTTSKNAANAELKPILDLQDENKIVPIEESHYLNSSLTAANFTRFDYSTAPTGIPYPNKTQAINLAIPSLTFTGATISGNGLAKDSRYQDESTFGYLNGNPARVINHDGTSTMYIWDYQNTNPIAKTVFSSVDTTCFTSFEADGTGNWTVASAVRDNTAAVTGTVCYNLTSGSITKPGLASGKKYIVSYWSKSASSYTVTGATVTTKAGRNTGGWYYYEHAVTMTGTTLTITGSNKIDELRMYPQGAQMTSYTYQPLVGMTTMNDPNGEITYYEYDGLARLKNVKDYQGNIIKNNQYNYVDPNACGGNCYVLTMQTLAGTNTIGYPVGVFNVNGGFVGNAANQAAYVTTWMSDATNAAAGTIVAGPDPLHFKFTVNPGKTIPNGLTGCRYYQFDVAWTNFDAFHNVNGVYIDFGDGTGMRLGVNEADSNVVRAPNTVINLQGGPGAYYIYWIHNYPNANSKTIRIYHNDANEQMGFDNAYAPATALTLMKNLTGNIPQHTTGFGGRCNQQASFLTTTGITNWSSINSVTNFELGTGDLMNACTHVSFPQDFMAGNKNLQILFTDSRGYYLPGYIDSTFKISRLKSDWNTYFTDLTMLELDDNHWNHEDLSALIHLSVVGIGSGSTLNSYSQTNNPLVPMTTTVIDNIINQVAAGAGHFVTNGFLNMPSGGGLRSAASNAGVTQLKSMNWTVVVNGVTQ